MAAPFHQIKNILATGMQTQEGLKDDSSNTEPVLQGSVLSLPVTAVDEVFRSLT